jgi:Rps23 Pro-64 3,4-dihydroxylase Tpa1-like proline 4-hydroxylase
MKLLGDWINNIELLSNEYKNNKPYPYIIINNFLESSFIDNIHNEYSERSTNLSDWHFYNNPLEVKYSFDNINNCGKNIQKLFELYSSKECIQLFNTLSGITNLEYDNTLHGCGLHLMPKNGRLSVHLDYEKHPILENKQRRMNIILYLNKTWNISWNGSTKLFYEDLNNSFIESKVVYNSALVFQTDDISWHGVPDKIKCPENESRKSIAYYYISELQNKPDNNKVGNDGSGYRSRATYINKTPYSEIDHFVKIRPIRRIEKEDILKFWPEWNNINY